jgi:hypothetical protein
MPNVNNRRKIPRMRPIPIIIWPYLIIMAVNESDKEKAGIKRKFCHPAIINNMPVPIASIVVSRNAALFRTFISFFTAALFLAANSSSKATIKIEAAIATGTKCHIKSCEKFINSFYT